MSDTSDQSPGKPAPRYRTARPKVPPFARYEGTSAWRKDRRRVRAYALFRAASRQAALHAKAPPAETPHAETPGG